VIKEIEYEPFEAELSEGVNQSLSRSLGEAVNQSANQPDDAHDEHGYGVNFFPPLSFSL
jgi:hypothetical protein